jgi:hypothetical protein
MAKPVTGLTIFQNNLVNSLVNLDNNFALLQNAINDPGSYSNYWADTGSANALVAAYTNFSIPSLQDGQIYTIKVAQTNTTANPTLKIASFTAAVIFKRDGGVLGPRELLQNQIYQFIYNSSLAGFNLIGSWPTGQNLSSSANQAMNFTLGGVSVPANQLSAQDVAGWFSIFTSAVGGSSFTVWNVDSTNNASGANLVAACGVTGFNSKGSVTLGTSLDGSGNSLPVLFCRGNGTNPFIIQSNSGAGFKFQTNGGSDAWSIGSTGILQQNFVQPFWSYANPAARSTTGIINYQTNETGFGLTAVSGTITVPANVTNGFFYVVAAAEVGYGGGVGGATATMEIFKNGAGTGYKAAWTENNNTTEHGTICISGIVKANTGDTIAVQFTNNTNASVFVGSGTFVGWMVG